MCISVIGEFDDILDRGTSKYADDSTQHIHLICRNVHPGFECNGPVTMDKFQKLLHIENLTLQTPTNRTTLINELSLQINCNDSLLVSLHFLIKLSKFIFCVIIQVH